MFPHLASAAIALMVFAGLTPGVFAAAEQSSARNDVASVGSSSPNDPGSSAGYDRLLDRRHLPSPGGYGSSAPDINGEGREPYDQRDFGRPQGDPTASSEYGLRGSRGMAHERGWGGYDRDNRQGYGE